MKSRRSTVVQVDIEFASPNPVLSATDFFSEAEYDGDGCIGWTWSDAHSAGLSIGRQVFPWSKKKVPHTAVNYPDGSEGWCAAPRTLCTLAPCTRHTLPASLPCCH